jgi:lipopolysaccharide export system protein LptA
MIVFLFSSKFIIFRALLILLMMGSGVFFTWAKGSKPSPQKAHGTPSLSASQEPITIDADHLNVFENKRQAVFAGNVHAIQDEVHLRCSQLSVNYEPSPGVSHAPLSSKKQEDEQTAYSEASLAEGVTITSMECQGPVTITADDQVVTGDHASFDKVAQALKVIGHAKLVKGRNILTGDRILYSLTDRVAHVEGRVKALFVPKEGEASPSTSRK